MEEFLIELEAMGIAARVPGHDDEWIRVDTFARMFKRLKSHPFLIFSEPSVNTVKDHPTVAIITCLFVVSPPLEFHYHSSQIHAWPDSRYYANFEKKNRNQRMLLLNGLSCSRRSRPSTLSLMTSRRCTSTERGRLQRLYARYCLVRTTRQ